MLDSFSIDLVRELSTTYNDILSLDRMTTSKTTVSLDKLDVLGRELRNHIRYELQVENLKASLRILVKNQSSNRSVTSDATSRLLRKRTHKVRSCCSE